MFSVRNRIFDKWLFNEFLGPFFAVLFGFLLFAILAMDLYQMIDLVSSKQVSLPIYPGVNFERVIEVIKQYD